MATNILAASSALIFEPAMPVDMATVKVNTSLEAVNPRLGPLWAIQFKICTMRYVVRLSAAPTQGEGLLKLVAGSVVIHESSINFSGNSVISLAIPVDLSQVAGESELKAVLEVTAGADAGITATLDSWLTVEVPVTISGC